jgi:hypothetical protein
MVENAKTLNRTHGDTAGSGPTPEYRTWQNIIKRCTDPTDKSWLRYGGAGIRICDKWRNSYETFLADMGRRPSSNHSIDRIENARGYEPGNCRWATSKEQRLNQRRIVLIEANGKALTLTDWVRHLGLSKSTVNKRLARGWSPKEALNLEPKKRWVGCGSYLRTKTPLAPR